MAVEELGSGKGLCDHFSSNIGNKFVTCVISLSGYVRDKESHVLFHFLQVAALTMDLNLGIISEGEKRLKKKLILDYLYSNLRCNQNVGLDVCFCCLCLFRKHYKSLIFIKKYGFDVSENLTYKCYSGTTIFGPIDTFSVSCSLLSML